MEINPRGTTRADFHEKSDKSGINRENHGPLRLEADQLIFRPTSSSQAEVEPAFDPPMTEKVCGYELTLMTPGYVKSAFTPPLTTD